MTHPFIFLDWIVKLFLGTPTTPEEVEHIHHVVEMLRPVSYTWLVMILLILIAVLVKNNIRTVPTGMQNFT